MVIVLVLETV